MASSPVGEYVWAWAIGFEAWQNCAEIGRRNNEAKAEAQAVRMVVHLNGIVA